MNKRMCTEMKTCASGKMKTDPVCVDVQEILETSTARWPQAT